MWRAGRAMGRPDASAAWRGGLGVGQGEGWQYQWPAGAKGDNSATVEKAREDEGGQVLNQKKAAPLAIGGSDAGGVFMVWRGAYYRLGDDLPPMLAGLVNLPR